MKERPILFSGEMVRAILDGRKTQTRRIVKPQFEEKPSDNLMWHCPYGKPGDRLWVRETFKEHQGRSDFAYYRADSSAYDFTKKEKHQFEDNEGISFWRPSIHMPRWASRITLEITNVRVERMQDGGDREFWGEEKWKQNPWVWVIEFRRIL